MTEQILVDCLRTFTTTFVNKAGARADPGVVTVYVTNPDGTVTSPTAVSDETGLWYVNLLLDIPGEWTVRFEGTVGLTEAAETTVYVLPSRGDAPR